MTDKERLHVLQTLDYEWRPVSSDKRSIPIGRWKNFVQLFHNGSAHVRYVIGKDRHALIVGMDLTKALVISRQGGGQYIVPAVIEFYDSLEHAEFVLQMRHANNEF